MQRLELKLATCSQLSQRSIRLSFSTFIACIFFLIASITELGQACSKITHWSGRTHQDNWVGKVWFVSKKIWIKTAKLSPIGLLQKVHLPMSNFSNSGYIYKQFKLGQMLKYISTSGPYIDDRDTDITRHYKPFQRDTFLYIMIIHLPNVLVCYVLVVG